jgi:hypothetical protein
MGWMINELQFKFQQGQETFLLSRVFRPAHTAFYSSRNQRHFLWGWKSWTVKLTTDLQLMLPLRMRGAIPALHHIPSQQAQGRLYLPFTRKCNIQNKTIYTSHGSRCIASYPLMMCLYTKNFGIQHYLTQVSVILLQFTESWKFKSAQIWDNLYGYTFILGHERKLIC